METSSSERVIKITVVNEDSGHEFTLEGHPHNTVAEMVDKMYAKLGVPRRPDDRLRCKSTGADVFPYANLTLHQYVEAGHCKCLVWLFVAERVVKITVVNEDSGHEFTLEGHPHNTVAEMIDKMYAKLGVPRRPDDRLRCESTGADVFPYANLTLHQYVEAGHCKCLVWLFAGGTGGASCR